MKNRKLEKVELHDKTYFVLIVNRVISSFFHYLHE